MPLHFISQTSDVIVTCETDHITVLHCLDVQFMQKNVVQFTTLNFVEFVDSKFPNLHITNHFIF